MSGTSDKVKGKYNQAAGKIKEETGDAFNNSKLENKGRAQQVKGKAEVLKGKIKDASN